MKAMYQRNRTPEVRDLLWEIARLQVIVRRAAQLSACFPMYDSHANSSAFHIILNALRRELQDEPCVLEAQVTLPVADETVSVDFHAARRHRRR